MAEARRTSYSSSKPGFAEFELGLLAVNPPVVVPGTPAVPAVPVIPPEDPVFSGLDDLKKDPSEYRQKDLFDARGFNATRLEIVRAGQTFAFEKTKVKNKEGQDEEKWRQLTPQARELDQPAFDTLLSALTAIRATGFVDAAAAKGLSTPELAATIKFDEGKKEEKVALAKSGADGFASRAGEPGAAKVDASAIDAVTKALQELK